MKIIRSGTSSYGRCWIEDHGTYWMVCLMDGKTVHGPYSNMADAFDEYHRYCP